MTEHEAVTIATKYVTDRALEHDGVRHVVWLPSDDPFSPRDDDLWYVYFAFRHTEELELLGLYSQFLIEVDDRTRVATLKPWL